MRADYVGDRGLGKFCFTATIESPRYGNGYGELKARRRAIVGDLLVPCGFRPGVKRRLAHGAARRFGAAEQGGFASVPCQSQPDRAGPRQFSSFLTSVGKYYARPFP